jgi:chitosanase
MFGFRTPTPSDPPPSPSARHRPVLRAVALSAVAVAVAAVALVASPAEAAFTSVPLVNKLSNTCLDVHGGSNTPGTAVEIFTCGGGANQRFTTTSSGQIQVTVGGAVRCLDANASGTGNGTKIIIWTCHSGTNQRWTHNADNSIRGVASGRCIDIYGSAPNNGNAAVLWDCKNGGNGSQTWTPSTTPPPSTGTGLDNPAKKDVAMQLVSAAENSSLNWRAQFSYIEDIGDGRGYTAGIIGFCSGTGDMIELVREYTNRKPGNILAKYLPALAQVDGTASHAGLDPSYPADWRTAAADPIFQKAQEDERDRVYFTPSVALAKADGVRALGQFAYYDAAVMHGFDGMKSVRAAALTKAKPPAQGGTETTWLNAFLDARVIEMNKEEAHSDTSRVDTAQRVFLRNGNLDLNTPLNFAVYGENFTIN